MTCSEAAKFIIRRRGRDEFNIWKDGEVFRNLRDIDRVDCTLY